MNRSPGTASGTPTCAEGELIMKRIAMVVALLGSVQPVAGQRPSSEAGNVVYTFGLDED